LDSQWEIDLMDALQALHPTDQTLSSYGLGQLDDATAESVNQHLESCPDCRRRVAEVSSDSFLGRLRDAQALGRLDSPVPIGPSTAGLSMAAGPNTPAPPLAGMMPAGLADHPDYEILRELGRGGMGVVYLAHNTLMGRPEVLKVVGSHLITRPGVVDRFRREIHSAAKLHHTNIVTAYSALRLGESLVLAMEYVEGLTWARSSRPGDRCRWPTRAFMCTRRPWAFSTRTSTAWSTATSSPPISCSPARERRRL
jgi:hypothetical protein